MKEELKRIQRGELQLFVPIIEQYLNSVYYTAKDRFGSEKAELVSADVFKRLYSNIVRFYRWQNPERFVKRSLIRACRYNKFKWSPSIQSRHEIVPERVTRGILLGLSRISHRKGIFNIVKAVAALVSVVILIISMLLAFQPQRHVDGTVYTDNIEPKSIYSKYYGSSYLVQKTVAGITKLGQEGMAIDIYAAGGESSSGKHYVEIWKFGKLIKTIDIEPNMTFVTGDFGSDIYIFRKDQTLYKYDSDGNRIDLLEVEGFLAFNSPNNKYLVFQKDADSYSIIDSLELKLDEEISGEFFSISDEGKVLYRSEQSVVALNHNKDKKIVQAIFDSNDYVAVIYEDGLVGVYNEEKVVWENQLTFPINQRPDSSIGFSVTRAFLLAGVKRLNVIVEYQNGTFFQSFANENGNKIVDSNETWHTGQIIPEPLISCDDRVLAYSSQIIGDDMLIRYAGIINTDIMPMREIRLSNYRQLERWNIESLGDEYYIYCFSTRAFFEVVNIDMSK